MTTEEALSYCADLTKRHSSTFHLGARLFPFQQRQAVMIVYALCRSGDDAVDEQAGPAARAALESWREQVARAYEGQPRSEDALELGLAWALERYDIPQSAFDELYLGFLSDLEHHTPETLEDLMLYCRRVAGVVGLMIAPIAGYSGGERTLLNAVALGQAMQLTNILRDVGEDLGQGRCYLPQALLRDYGVELSLLRQGSVSAPYVALLERLADIANRLYALGWQSIPQLAGAGAAAVGVAALNYQAILARLRENRYDNLSKRAYLTPVRRLSLVPRALAGAYGGSQMRRLVIGAGPARDARFLSELS